MISRAKMSRDPMDAQEGVNRKRSSLLDFVDAS